MATPNYKVGWENITQPKFRGSVTMKKVEWILRNIYLHLIIHQDSAQMFPFREDTARPLSSYVEALISNGMVFGGEAFGN